MSRISVILSVKRMKSLLNIVAFALVALLAAQPVLASASCGMGMADKVPCAPACGMQTSEMGADCQMNQQAVGSVCDQDCCRDGLPLGLAQLAATDKQRTPRADLAFWAQPDAPLAQGAAAKARPPIPIISAAPSRYILFRVFRI